MDCLLTWCPSLSSAPCRLSSDVPSLQCLRKELVWLQQSLTVLGSPVVLCHNDLLCKNIVYNQREGELTPETLMFISVSGRLSHSYS